MIAITHLWSLLRARLGRRARNRRALQRRRLEALLRDAGLTKAKTRSVSWHYFNDDESKP